MGITLRTLLEEALYLSIADREFLPIEPNGSQINVASDIFERLLSQYENQIPFYTEKVINGEAELLNVNAQYVNAMDYLLGNVVYNMTPVTQEEFSRVALIVGLRAIPSWFWLDRANNAIRVYPLPQSTSDTFVIGYRPLEGFSRLEEQLATSVTPFMQEFLIYALAHKLCDQYNIPWTPQKQATKQEAYRMLLNNSENRPSLPVKTRLKADPLPVPWLAYLSGNTPGGL